MTDAVAQHVFDRFYRADPSRKRTTGGTGLGLAISAEDAALHSGLLTVLSCPHQGSAFTLLLPRHQGQEIDDIPAQVENQDLVIARQQWAIDHPEDIMLSENLEESSLQVHQVRTEVSLGDERISREAGLPRMPAELPAEILEATPAHPLPRMSENDSVIDIQERIKNLEAPGSKESDNDPAGETS